MDHVEDTQEVLLACDKHLLLECLAPKRGVISKSQLQGRLKGHEHNHEVDCLTTVLDIFGIVLTCQLIHMLAHALDMILQKTFLLLWRLGVDILLIRHQRHLRVDDGILTLWIVQDDVGLHLASCLVVLQRAPHLIAQTGLHLVMDALGESLTGQQVTQDNLTHVTTHLIVTTQHIGQSFRFLSQLLRLLHHLDHLFTEGCRMGSTLFLILTDSLLHVGDSILQGLGDARHGLCVRLLQF